MVVLQSTTRTGSWTQFRSFSKSFAQLERFTRESLRNRIYKQNLKDVVKQNAHHPGPSKPPPLPADVIHVRPSRDLWKALGFTVAVGVGSFTAAYVSLFENIRSRTKNLRYFGAEDNLAPVEKPDQQKFPWGNLTAGDKATIYFVGANALVFLMWKLKPLKPVMLRYFCNCFVAPKRLFPPMLLSPFSHSCVYHFGANMFLFYSIANHTIDQFLGPGQFWAFFCTSAVVSSLTSLVLQAAIRSPIRALGATGPIFALLSYRLMRNPDARLQFDYFPDLNFTNKHAVYTLILYNAFCLCLFSRFRLRLIDPAAYLGGLFFGAFYALIGEQFERKHFERGVLSVYIWFMKKARVL